MMRVRQSLVALCLALVPVASGADAAAVWQWSVPMGEGRAFLWIPEDCAQVRAVVLAQHNMIEQGILEHAVMRRALAGLGIAEVFIAPPFDRPFRFDAGAGERFEAMMEALAHESGYDELPRVPVAPMGHSACASFPWNFAAWRPDRTLAVLSIKGDAPQTDLTGSGAPNPDWGTRRMDGIPGLMVMSEQEWWEARLEPLLRFREAHPATPLAVLCDVGHGHFDASATLVEFLAMFVRKAAEARLPRDGSTTLLPVDPALGWVAGRWRRGNARRVAPCPAAEYRCDPAEVFWSFDEATAQATTVYQARGDGREVQQVGFVQEGALVPIATTHAGVELRFLPEDDGITFSLAGAFIVPIPPRPPVAAKDAPRLPPPTSVRPALAARESHAPGAVGISVITGPAAALGGGRFQVAFDRTSTTSDQRTHDVWLLAAHAGDDHYRGAVQQALLRLPRIDGGLSQMISFPGIADQSARATSIDLNASSDRGLPVGYFVREGPAVIRDGRLHVTAIPPRARMPMRVTVVAWQLGRQAGPRVNAAAPVERSFLLLP